MRHRVFIAINLPEDIIKQLSAYQLKWPELSIRWTKKDNLHITLEFLGYIADKELLPILQNAKGFAFRHKSFAIKFNKIIYGPPDKMPPRMVWAVGEKIEELGITPHVTLGRIKTWQWKQIELDERPEVNEDINLSFEVNSIEVMESVLGRGGPKYTILESCQLKS